MITKTFKEIKEFSGMANMYILKNPNNKLSYALEKVGRLGLNDILTQRELELKKIKNRIVGNAQLENALTDKVTGAIIFAPKDSGREFEFGPGGLKAMNLANEQYEYEKESFITEYNKRTFEIEEYIISEIPENLSLTELEIFKDFVIK